MMMGRRNAFVLPVSAHELFRRRKTANRHRGDAARNRHFSLGMCWNHLAQMVFSLCAGLGLQTQHLVGAIRDDG
jgi:hypothetical protein